MARRRSNPRPLWIAGIAGAAALVIGGVAYAASKSKSSSSAGTGPGACPNGYASSPVSDTTTAQALLAALGGGSGPGPGVYYGTYQGQPFMYVNNMDGSQGTTYPGTPKGSTGFYTCN
jgi:hypothetical protein